MARASLLNGPKGSGEGITHCNAVRMRVVGEASLLMTLKSLGTTEQIIEPFTLTTVTDIQPTRLANFKNQRISLEIATEEIDEWFKVNRIIIFIKPIFTDLPSSFSV